MSNSEVGVGVMIRVGVRVKLDVEVRLAGNFFVKGHPRW